MALELFITRTPDGLDFPLPSYSSENHMALNLQAGIASSIKINPRERVYVPTGFVFGIPKGYCGQVVSLPQLAKESGIIVSDAPSLIHPADRNPLFILLGNTSPNQFILHRGQVVAQLLITPATQVYWKELASPHMTQQEKTSTERILLDQQKTYKSTPSKRVPNPLRDK